MGTCTYTLTQPCWLRSPENYFIVSATNEFRGGNLEASYVKTVQVQVFNLRISMIKGRKVMVRACAGLPGPTPSPCCISSPRLLACRPCLADAAPVSETPPPPPPAPWSWPRCCPCPRRLSLQCPPCLCSWTVAGWPCPCGLHKAG